MSRRDYTHSLFCAKCCKFVKKESTTGIRLDTAGRLLCGWCGTHLRLGPRRTGSKEKMKMKERFGQLQPL